MVYSCFLPPNYITRYCETQQFYLLTPEVHSKQKVHKVKNFCKYHYNNYTSATARYNINLWNLWKRMEHLNFTNNLTEIMNRWWKNLVGTRANIYVIGEALSLMAAASVVDYETLKFHKTHGTKKYNKWWNKKKGKVIARDSKIQNLMRQFKKITETTPYDFNTIKSYIQSMVNILKPYSDKYEVEFEQQNTIDEELKNNIDDTTHDTFDYEPDDVHDQYETDVDVNQQLTIEQQNNCYIMKSIDINEAVCNLYQNILKDPIPNIYIEQLIKSIENSSIYKYINAKFNLTINYSLQQQTTKHTLLQCTDFQGQYKNIPPQSLMLFKIQHKKNKKKYFVWHPVFIAIVDSVAADIIILDHESSGNPYRYIEFHKTKKYGNMWKMLPHEANNQTEQPCII